MRDRRLDASDMRIKCALTALVDEMPTVGKSEGWERIKRTLYSEARNSSRVLRWRIAMASVAVVIALAFGLMRIPAVNAWSWKAIFASRDLGGTTWQPGADLDSVLGVPFEPLIADPGSSDWTLQATAVDIRNGAESVVALRYKDVTGAVFTLRESPALDPFETPDYNAQDPNQFLLKVGNSNVVFFLPGSGFSSASWVTDGLHIGIWGSGGIQALVKLIESLVPYP